MKGYCWLTCIKCMAIVEEGAVALARALKKNRSLVTLDLGVCRGEKGTRSGMKLLFDSHLNAGQRSQGRRSGGTGGSAAAQQLCHLFGSWSMWRGGVEERSVVKLTDKQYNAIGEGAAVVLSRALERNNSITRLNLAVCFICSKEEGERFVKICCFVLTRMQGNRIAESEALHSIILQVI